MVPFAPPPPFASLRRLAGAVALCALVAGGAAAGPGGDDFWPRPDPPAAQVAYADAMARGDAFTVAARHDLDGDPPRATLRSRRYAELAAEAYELAARLDPRAGEPHYRAAEVLRLHFADSDKVARRVLAHWDAFEQRDPLSPRTAYLMDRALVLSRLGGDDHYRRAVADYDRLLATSGESQMDPGDAATLLTNAAEILMALGQLDQAIEHYRRGLDRSDQALYRYGLAVALDRDGQHGKALEQMRAAAQYDQLHDLSRDGVFFVPDGDVYYYYGLGYEALGELDRAVWLYQKYLADAPASRYHARAEETLARLRKAHPRLKAWTAPPPTVVFPGTETRRPAVRRNRHLPRPQRPPQPGVRP